MFNNKVLGFIPFIDSDGVQHTMAVSVLADVENETFYALVEVDGEPVAPAAAPSIDADIYVKWTI